METKKTTKKKPVDLSKETQENSFFNVPAGIKEELSKKGFECRWINSIKYRQNFGFHRSGWKAYKTTAAKLAPDSLDFGDGVDAEGYIRRGDLVLAVKPSQAAEQHREKIRAKNRRLMNYSQTAADDLRKTVGGSGAVLEGYDENGGDDE